VEGLSAMRNEAAGLLELRGANALFTPFLSFFSFLSRNGEQVRVSATGRTFAVLAYS